MRILSTLILLFLSINSLAQSPEEKLSELNILLPKVNSQLGNYVDVVRAGQLLFLSGKGPLTSDGNFLIGKVGKELSVAQGYEAAKLTAINQIAVLKQELKDLSRVKRIVKVNGFVNSDSDFFDQPKVINGFSDLMCEVFGDAGKHARTALGTNSLPLNMVVEIEMIIEFK